MEPTNFFKINDSSVENNVVHYVQVLLFFKTYDYDYYYYTYYYYYYFIIIVTMRMKFTIFNEPVQCCCHDSIRYLLIN